MSANLKPITLTDQERAQAREKLYEEQKRSFAFIREALGEASPVQARLAEKAFATDDAILFLECCKELVKDYIESELAEDAERELLASKDINGKKYFTE
jgi:hypothetical protein